jgi:hypothetical protein
MSIKIGQLDILLIYTCIIHSYFEFSFIKIYECDIRLAAVDNLQSDKNSIKTRGVYHLHFRLKSEM